jgi:hypothetical protein
MNDLRNVEVEVSHVYLCYIHIYIGHAFYYFIQLLTVHIPSESWLKPSPK